LSVAPKSWRARAFHRMYIEQFTDEPSRLDNDAQEALAPIIQVALGVSKLAEFTGREKPTVIT
jgi:phosphoglucomutase